MAALKKFAGKIDIYHLIEGAKQAEGLVVIIDVFRAFSLECYLNYWGVKMIRPVGSIEDAFSLKEQISNSVLVGERKGKKCEGFDYGNSPSTIDRENVKGKYIIHTTSAGTQGIVNAVKADEIITGSFVNARAIAEYIMEKNPAKVSLVCMGNGGLFPAEEDELCARYIKSILEGEELECIEELVQNLRYKGGEHFFNEQNQEIFPQEDFWMCIQYNQFDFDLQVKQDELGFMVQPKSCSKVAQR